MVDFDFLLELPGGCSPRQAAAMYDVIRKERPAVAIEVGVASGRSLLPLAMAMRDNGHGEVIAIDSWLATWQQYEDCMTAIGDAHLWPWVRVISAESHLAGLSIEAEAAGFVHLDGSRLPADSDRDARIYWSKLKRNGVIWLDGASDPGVQRGLAFLNKAGDWEGSIDDCRIFRKRVRYRQK